MDLLPASAMTAAFNRCLRRVSNPGLPRNVATRIRGLLDRKLGVQVRQLKGLHHLRATCRNCGASVVTNPYQTGDVVCQKCGTFNKNTPTFLQQVRRPVPCS